MPQELQYTPVRKSEVSTTRPFSEKGVRLAQKMQVGPCVPVGIQLEKTEVGPTSGPSWRLSHLPRARTVEERGGEAHRQAQPGGVVAVAGAA